MLFATELTNECTLYLITRLTPRAHPHGADPPQIILTQRASLLLLYFSFLTLSFLFFFSHLFTRYLIESLSRLLRSFQKYNQFQLINNFVLE